MRDWQIAAGLGLLAVACHAPLARTSVGGCDEWHILHSAVRMLEGDVLYRDTTHIAGPGVFCFTAALFALFGVRLEVERYAILVVFAVVTAAVYLLARRVTTRVPAALAALWFVAFRLWAFPHWHFVHYASLAMAANVLAFLVLAPARGPALGRAVAAGLFAGAAVLTKQDSGALGILACATALVLATRARAAGEPVGRALAGFVAAAALPGIVAVGWLAAHGALGDLFRQTVLNTLVHRQMEALPWPSLRPLTVQDPVLRARLLSYVPALFWDLHWRTVLASPVFRDTNLLDLAVKAAFRIPFLVVAAEIASTVLAWRGRRSRGAPPPAMLAARTAQCVFATALLAAFQRPHDWIHLSVLLAPVAPVAARQGAALAAAWPLATRLAAGAVGALYLALSLELGWRTAHTYTAPIDGPRGRVFARPADAVSLGDAIAALQATPADRPVLAVPCVSAATFLAARPLVSRFPWIWPNDIHPDRDTQVLASLDASPGATLLYTLTHMPFLPRLQRYASPLFEGLALRYRIGPIFGPDAERLIFTIGVPRMPEDPGTVVRLGEHLGDADAATARDGRIVAHPDARAVAGVATWPLTPDVVWVAPTPGGETRVMVPLAVPARGRLRLEAGVNPDLWQALAPLPVHMRVAIHAPAGETDLLSFDADVYARPEDRRWRVLDVPLDRFAGERVRVVFAAGAVGWVPGDPEVAGFAAPRVVVPVAEAAP
jgi:hypothetical protein